MLIVCPSCATSYRVHAAALGATGRSVRCVRCRNVWFAHDREPQEITAESWPDGTLGTPEVALPRWDSADWPPGSSETAPIVDGPSLAPPAPIEAIPADDPAIRPDIATFAASRKPRRRTRPTHWSLPLLPIAILALLALDAALIAWRADVVKVAPQTASLYAAIGLPVNLRGLTFSNIATSAETQDGVQVLVVEGTIASAANRVVDVPQLRFSVRNPAGQEVYAWTALPTRNLLSPGETLPFRSRLAAPPPEARDVLVRFFDGRDLVAGIQ